MRAAAEYGENGGRDPWNWQRLNGRGHRNGYHGFAWRTQSKCGHASCLLFRRKKPPPPLPIKRRAAEGVHPVAAPTISARWIRGGATGVNTLPRLELRLGAVRHHAASASGFRFRFRFRFRRPYT
jgi:hypothetical protein